MYLDNELAELLSGDNFSKIISLHKRAHIGCSSYKKMLNFFSGDELVMPPVSGERNFYNVVSCKEEYVSDDDVLMMMAAFGEYVQQNHFVPILEIARELSNLVFIIETKIPYTGNTYRFDDDDVRSSLQKVCKKIYKSMKVKVDTKVCISLRSYKKKVYFKVHFLLHYMDIHNRVHLTKLAAKELLNINDECGGIFTEVYPIKYSEPYLTSVLPMNAGPDHYYWDIFSVFELRSKFGIQVVQSTKSALLEMCADAGNTFAILSINMYNTAYKKVLYSNPAVERYESNNVSQTERLILLKHINEYPRLAFVDLVLRHLPAELKGEVQCRNILWSLKVENIDYIALLAKHHFGHLEPKLFDKLWYGPDKRSMFGYYANLVSSGEAFREELRQLIERIIEREFYNGSGALSDFICAMVVNFQYYGKFYYYSKVNKSGGPTSHYSYMFVDLHDQEDEKKLYKWTTYADSPLIANFINEQLYKTANNVIDGLAISGSSYSKDEKTKSLNKHKTAFMKSVQNLRDSAKFNKIMSALNRSFLNSPLFPGRIDSDNSVIGVLNGVLDLDLNSDIPNPVMYKGYSPFVVTRHCSAKYIPYEKVKAKGKYLAKIKSLFKTIIPEDDARKKCLYWFSTAIDEATQKKLLLILEGWGSNGKSTITDPLVELLDDYAVKLSPNVITSARKGSQADPDFMAMMGKRLGLIAETNSDDKLVAARLKAATESIKDGRGLYRDSENFRSQPTLILSTNYPLRFEDFDDGTMRRVVVYKHKVRFLYNPDPNNPNEKKIDPTLSNLFNKQEAKNELFSWLVHLRIKLHLRFGSDIHRVPSPTIDAYTSAYRCEQDLLTQFIYQRIVIMIGYSEEGRLRLQSEKTQEQLEKEIDEEYESLDPQVSPPHTISMDTIAKEYREWAAQFANKEIKDGFNTLLNLFKTSALAKYIVGDLDLAHLKGMRVLKLGKIKVKGEMHIPYRK
jgi:phage/plasmid-associated DNA primase